jgi:hypothetical protein
MYRPVDNDCADENHPASKNEELREVQKSGDIEDDRNLNFHYLTDTDFKNFQTVAGGTPIKRSQGPWHVTLHRLATV